MASTKLPVKHILQDDEGECLAACAAMLLNYLGKPTSYKRLMRLLGVVSGYGALASNIMKLEKLGVYVLYQQGTLELLRSHLEQGSPIIAFVDTSELPHWSLSTHHAIVIVGMSDTKVFINDPEFQNAPIPIPIGDFDLAWLEQDEMYAVLIEK